MNEYRTVEIAAFLIPSCFSTTSSKDVYNLVSNGEYIAVPSYESSVVALINDGAPIECIYMEEGNTAMAGGVGLIRKQSELRRQKALQESLEALVETETTEAETEPEETKQRNRIMSRRSVLTR
ncbi:MAG: hypothetical protein LIO92_07125 [Clostridiales bacterium]|nr:hypothetical protein [Clostridiales bacterium]